MLKVKIYRITRVFLFLILLAGISISSYAQDKVLAIVNKEIITQKDLSDFLNFMAIQLSAKYPSWEVQERIEAAKGDILNRLIEDKLILQEAKSMNISIDDNRLKAKMEQLKSQYSSEEEFEESLMRQGLTPADIESKMREQMMIFGIIELKIKDKIIIDPAEVTDFYQKYAEEFNEPEGRRVSTLVMNDNKSALEVLDFLSKGGKLEEVSGKYAAEFEDFGVIRKGQSRKEIEDVIFVLGIGETSKIVKLGDKYYILKVKELVPPKQVTLDEVREKIHSFLYESKLQEALVRWIDELKAKYYVEIKEN